MNNQKYIIRWRSKITGHVGQGISVFSKAVAEGIVERMNKNWPDNKYWSEALPASS